MAVSPQLTATVRSERGKGVARRLRKKGMIPGVLYGHNISSTPLTIDGKQLERLIVDSKGEHKLFKLTLEGEVSAEKTVMIKELQIDPVQRNYLHVDLFEVAMDEELTIAIPIILVGIAEGVKLGGVLQQARRELEIKCLPSAIPDALEIDVSALGIGDSIHLNDIELPPGIRALEDANLTIVTVLAPTVEKEVVAEVAPEAKAEEEKAAAAPATEEKKTDEGDKAKG